VSVKQHILWAQKLYMKVEWIALGYELPLIWIGFLYNDLSCGIHVTPVCVFTWCSSQFMEGKKMSV